MFQPVDPKPIRETILDAVEECLDAQLRAMRRLRRAEPNSSNTSPRPGGAKRSRSQVDMAYDILKEAGQPLHISELLARIKSRFEVQVDRESLVSALTKRVARADRFVRTDKNTFALRKEPLK
jgi:sugar-specific transcriptional regulator TrmB